MAFLKLNWTVGTTYKFLVRAAPSTIINATVFTAWFGDPLYNKTIGGWRLIASWTVPKTRTYLRGIYHFIQNFDADKGNITRLAELSNQRYYDETLSWKEVKEVIFTKD